MILLALGVLIGLLLRITMLGLDVRFHPDEALFATQARLVKIDPLLRTTDLDKPPLTIYSTALSFGLFGTSEFAARLPNVFLSGLSLALLAALAQALYGNQKITVLAVFLLAISPYDLAFAATAFTDIQATFWVLLAVLLAVRDRWKGAGFAAALVFASKPTALLFLPLILALGIARQADPRWTSRDMLRRLWEFVWPLALGIGFVVLWDHTRAPRSFLSLGYARNNPGRLIRPDEVWPRLETWLHWLKFATGVPTLNVALLAAGVAGLAREIRRGRSHPAAMDLLIAGFVLAFLAWHWLVAFNTYDRYLHALIPFVLLLAARIIAGVIHGGPLRAGIGIALLVVILPATVHTLHGETPIGGDQGQHTGIDSLAQVLNTEFSGEIIYDHWLGWELAYYLGETPQVIVLYMPLPEALADDMVTQPYPRYFVAPSTRHAAPWLAALRRRDIAITEVYNRRFVIYQLRHSSG